MAAEFLGAVLMVLPDLPYLRVLFTPTVLAESRRKLFDTTSLMAGSSEYESILKLVQDEWDSELREDPSFFLMEKPGPGFERSLFAVYDGSSEGPFGDLMNEDGTQEIPEEFDDLQQYIWENDDWDVICAKQVLDEWISEKIEGEENKELSVRAGGFLLFIIGFSVQFL